MASIGGERRGDKWATARGVMVRLALLTSAKQYQVVLTSAGAGVRIMSGSAEVWGGLNT